MEFWSPVMGSVIMLLLLLPVHATAPAVQLVSYLFAIFKIIMNMRNNHSKINNYNNDDNDNYNINPGDKKDNDDDNNCKWL